MIPALRKILDDYREKFPPKTSDFVFRGDKMGFALHPDNVSRRVITPILREKWAGWHSFRGGLGTRLFYLWTDAKTVQMISAACKRERDHGALHHPRPSRSTSRSGEILEGFGLQMDPTKPLKKGKKSRRSHKH